MKKYNKAVIALTGGMASGKSLVTDLLFQIGNCTVVNSDQLAHQVMSPGGSAYHDLISYFGEDILEDAVKDDQELRAIDRSKLRALVFNGDKDSTILKQKLESITHPKILEAAKNEFKKADKDYILWEVPLLYETGLYKEVDKVIIVTCSRETQVLRAKRRNSNLTEEVIDKILDTQVSNQQRESIADYIITNNDGISVADLMQKVEKLNKQILLDLQKEYKMDQFVSETIDSDNINLDLEDCFVSKPQYF